MEEVACFCGAQELDRAVILSRDDHSGETFSYRACLACGAERITPRPGREQIGAYYPTTYASHRVRGESLAERVKKLICLNYQTPGGGGLFMRALLRPLRAYTVFNFQGIEPRRIFEFGAASGNDLALFREAQWAVAGCEPSSNACRLAAERGIDLQNTSAESAALDDHSVACVLINNVLEHVHDPAAVVSKAYRALVPGGSLVMVVPNHRAWSARWFGAAWPGYDAPRHLWGFTPDSLAGLLGRAGFMPPGIHHRFQGLWAWSSALDGRHAAAPVPAWRRRWARQLSYLLFPVGVLGALVGAGDFLTVVARKPVEAGALDRATP